MRLPAAPSQPVIWAARLEGLQAEVPATGVGVGEAAGPAGVPPAVAAALGAEVVPDVAPALDGVVGEQAASVAASPRIRRGTEAARAGRREDMRAGWYRRA